MTLTVGTRAQHSRSSEETRVPMMYPMSFPRLACLLVLLVGAVSTAPAAADTTTPCVPGSEGPLCESWTGRATFVADGDTIDVDLDGDAVSTPVRVRISGIQAMEQSAYSHLAAKRRGDCHALEATARLEQLIAAGGGVVRLTAQDPDNRNRDRLLRSVAVLIDGQWQDVGRILIGEGHALAFPARPEWAWNATYATLAQQVAPTGIGLWDPIYCGGPPSALKLWVHWDAEGNDALRPDDEWVRIRNLDTAPVSLGGWTLRDSALNRFWFPLDTVVGAGETITVQVGVGSGALLSWGRSAPIFDNVDAARAVGDGAYLFDPAGDLRAWMQYPCRVACSDPNAGAFDLRVQPGGRELIAVRNTGDTPIELDGYQLLAGSHSFAFPPGSVLQPTETLRVRTDSSVAGDSRLDLSWGASGTLLPNDAGTVRLATFDGIVLACRAWGTADC
jgi:endonuclease YncB( thermonuclease family)